MVTAVKVSETARPVPVESLTLGAMRANLIALSLIHRFAFESFDAAPHNGQVGPGTNTEGLILQRQAEGGAGGPFVERTALVQDRVETTKHKRRRKGRVLSFLSSYTTVPLGEFPFCAAKF